MKRFYINCTIRVLLLSATICTLAYLFFKTDFLTSAIFVCLLGAYQIFALIRYVTQTNRDLTRLLDSIKYSDFSQSFTNNLKGSGFEELHAAFTDVIKEFQSAKIEKEEHFRFLQTIVDHVGIGLIAFDPEGEVELINSAAKKLLKIPRLGNIRDLESVSSRLPRKLYDLSPGGYDLVKLQQGDARGAKKGFEKIVKQYSSNHIVWHHLGMSYQHLNEHTKALKAYRKSVNLKPGFIDSWVNLGIAYKELGSTELAIQASEKALKIQADHPRALNLLGSIQAGNQEFELAKVNFKKTILVDSNNWDAIFNLANVNFELGNYDETHRLLEQLNGQDPENKRQRELQAQCFIFQKQYKAADPIIKGLESDYPRDEKVLRLALSLKEGINDHFGVIDLANESNQDTDNNTINHIGKNAPHEEMICSFPNGDIQYANRNSEYYQ